MAAKSTLCGQNGGSSGWQQARIDRFWSILVYKTAIAGHFFMVCDCLIGRVFLLDETEHLCYIGDDVDPLCSKR
jgi:hypothetical protein